METKKRISLVVLAAGMGSRYGGLKQMDAFGPNGETIIDYSLYDAQRAGFNHVVFIIREFFADKFKEAFESKLMLGMTADYVYQELENLPFNVDIPAEREKPWGTGHAIWVAKPYVDGPFAVINADDYYGVDSYKTLYDFLTSSREPEEYAVMGYKLDNTLSEHGTVNRGICHADEKDYLKHIVETKNIGRDADGTISYLGAEGHPVVLNKDTPVSMNMFGFYPSYFEFFENQFKEFIEEQGENLTSEFYIPTLVDNLIRNGLRKTKVLHSDAEWFGVTYKEDKEFVSDRLRKLIEEGVYPERLW